MLDVKKYSKNNALARITIQEIPLNILREQVGALRAIDNAVLELSAAEMSGDKYAIALAQARYEYANINSVMVSLSDADMPLVPKFDTQKRILDTKSTLEEAQATGNKKEIAKANREYNHALLSEAKRRGLADTLAARHKLFNAMAAQVTQWLGDWTSYETFKQTGQLPDEKGLVGVKFQGAHYSWLKETPPSDYAQATKKISVALDKRVQDRLNFSLAPSEEVLITAEVLRSVIGAERLSSLAGEALHLNELETLKLYVAIKNQFYEQLKHDAEANPQVVAQAKQELNQCQGQLKKYQRDEMMKALGLNQEEPEGNHRTYTPGRQALNDRHHSTRGAHHDKKNTSRPLKHLGKN